MSARRRSLTYIPSGALSTVLSTISRGGIGRCCSSGRRSVSRCIATVIGTVGSREKAEVARAEEQRRINPPVAQPVARVHPDTGRKALYIGEKVKRFDGMTEEESRPLIDYLVRHATRPEFCYRHQWRRNDIVAWDNRGTMHLALGDFDERQLRHMERTTVLGTPSGYVVAGG